MKRSSEDGIYQRTRKRVKESEYKGQATIQDLPVEIMWKIIDYLEDDDVFVYLGNVCENMSAALTAMFYHQFNMMPMRIEEARQRLLNKLYESPIEDESFRLDVTKSLLYLDWLESELVIFKGIIVRYNINSNNHLFPQMWNILKEILKRIDSLFNTVPLSTFLADIRVVNPASSLPLWSNFIEEFDEELEPTLGWNHSFETKVVDIITCSQISNINVEIKKMSNTKIGLKAFFQIQDTCSDRHTIDITGNDNNDFEKAILKFLRETIRTKNSWYINSVFEDMRRLENSLILTYFSTYEIQNMLDVLEESYRRLASPVYEPFQYFNNKTNNTKYFSKISTYNVSNNYIECFIENNGLNETEIPLIALYPHMFNVVPPPKTQNQIMFVKNENKTGLEEKQLCDSIGNLFTLQIYYRKRVFNNYRGVSKLITTKKLEDEENCDNEISYLVSETETLEELNDET